jgi:hypothetical protein
MTKWYDLEPGFPPPHKTKTKTGRRYTPKYWGPNYVSTPEQLDFYRRTGPPVTVARAPRPTADPATAEQAPNPEQPPRLRAKPPRP